WHHLALPWCPVRFRPLPHRYEASMAHFVAHTALSAARSGKAAGLSLLLSLSGFAGLLAVAGCSGSGGGTASVAVGGALALHSCSLGCSSTGCLTSDIAQNEQIVLRFTNNVDPLTVNTSTI